MLDILDALDTQIESGKAKAFKVLHNKDLSYEEQILALHFVLSKHYNIPIFSAYLKERTVEELVFEVELIKLSRTPTTQNTSELLNSNKKEVEDMFDDWEEVEATPPVLSDKEKEMFGDFMKTGDFK